MKDYHARLITLAIMCSGLMVSDHFYTGLIIYGVLSFIETAYMRDM